MHQASRGPAGLLGRRFQGYGDFLFTNLKPGPKGRGHCAHALDNLRHLRGPGKVRWPLSPKDTGDIGKPLDFTVADEAAHQEGHKRPPAEPVKIMDKVRQRVEDGLALVHLNGLGLVGVMADDHVSASVDGEVAHLLLVLDIIGFKPSSASSAHRTLGAGAGN